MIFFTCRMKTAIKESRDSNSDISFIFMAEQLTAISSNHEGIEGAVATSNINSAWYKLFTKMLQLPVRKAGKEMKMGQR